MFATLILILPAFFLLQLQLSRLYGSPSLNTFSFLEIPYPFYKLSVMMNVTSVLDMYPYLMILFPLLISLAAYGFWKMYKQHKKQALFLGSHFIVPIAILSIAGFFLPVHSYRYFVFLLPIYVLFISYALASLQHKKFLWILLFLILLGWSIINGFYYATATNYHWAIHLGV